MKTFLSLIMVLVGFLYLTAHAQTATPTPPPATNPVGAVVSAAATAAVTAAVQTAGAQVSQGLTTGQGFATFAILYGAVSAILSGIQQLLGLGARSKSPKLASASAKALAVVQHATGNPQVSTPQASST